MHTLLVGGQVAATSMENGTEISSEHKTGSPVGSSVALLSLYP